MLSGRDGRRRWHPQATRLLHEQGSMWWCPLTPAPAPRSACGPPKPPASTPPHPTTTHAHFAPTRSLSTFMRMSGAALCGCGTWCESCRRSSRARPGCATGAPEGVMPRGWGRVLPTPVGSVGSAAGQAAAHHACHVHSPAIAGSAVALARVEVSSAALGRVACPGCVGSP